MQRSVCLIFEPRTGARDAIILIAIPRDRPERAQRGKKKSLSSESQPIITYFLLSPVRYLLVPP